MQEIGRYVVVRELGRGAMGIVFEARDPLIGRTVAVKIIRLDALGTSSEADWLQERLFREARSAGTLSHPGIVVIFDLGRHEDVAYIAMERVDGPTLEQVLAMDPRLSTAESLSILRQTAAALDYAHHNDVVHRDIKPGNLMLHKGVTLKITDFGIAKIASTQQLTRTGTVMGTPSYMSPEQITAQPVDGRADQFSLAVIAFQLLTGRKPFQGDTLATLVHQIVYEERPSARLLRPDLPEAVDAVLKRGLSRNASDRYPSCTAFVDALDSSLLEESLLGRSLAQVPRPLTPELEPAPAAVVETRCAVCGATLADGQLQCSVCARVAGAETSFNELFGAEPAPPAATETWSWPLAESQSLPPPDPVPSDLPAPPPPPPPEPPGALEHPAPRIPDPRQGARRPWSPAQIAFAAAAAIALILVVAAILIQWPAAPHVPAAPNASAAPQANVERDAPQPASKPPAAPVVTRFEVSPSSIKAGQSALLAWSVADATSVRIDPVLGLRPPTGTATASPEKTTTFTLVAAGAGGEARRSVTVAVVAQPAALSNPAAQPLATPAVSPNPVPQPSATTKAGSADDAEKAYAAGDYKRVRALAEQGNAAGQHRLGVMYYAGMGVPKDDAQAVAWFAKAADQGYAPAQDKLGLMYSSGQGVPRNVAQAIAWYKKAADQGFTASQENLGLLYEYGLGVQKDPTQAIDWYRKAADNGSQDAKDGLKRLGAPQK